MSYNQLKMEKY